MNELELYSKIDLSKDPVDIVTNLDDNGSPIRLSSMTNSTFSIKVDGNYRVIRIPGKGTENFIDRFRESKIIKILQSSDLSVFPKFIYYNNGVCVTEKLFAWYKEFNQDSNGEIPAKLLSELHSNIISTTPKNKLRINLIDELRFYDKIISDYSDNLYGHYPDLREVYNIIIRYISNHQRKNEVLCHRDLMYNNIMVNLRNPDKSKLIDWEYSGFLNKYWDIGCFVSEVRLWFDKLNSDRIINEFLSMYEKSSEELIDTTSVEMWSAVVDYVWAIWSLAKIALGEDDLEYGIKRYSNCVEVLKSYE